jgi:HEAT repeats
MFSKFSNTSKILTLSLLVGIIIASILNFTSKPAESSSGISETHAKKMGYKDSQELYKSAKELGNAFDRTKANKFQLTQQDAQIFINYIETGSEASKSDATMMLGKLISRGKEVPNGVRETFEKAAKSPSPKVRLGIAMGLHSTHDPKLRQIFVSLKNDPSPEVRAEVINVLHEEEINKGNK